MTKTIYISPKGEKSSIRPNVAIIEGGYIYSPSDEDMQEAGWTITEEIVPEPEQDILTYAELVEKYIKEHGYPTYGAELAVLNNYAINPTIYADAFAAYQQIRNEAKEWAVKVSCGDKNNEPVILPIEDNTIGDSKNPE